MAPTVPTSEPQTLTAGTTWRWTRSFADFPTADGWSLTYGLAGPTPTTITTTIVGSEFSVTVATATTAAITAGIYTWTAYASLGGEKYVADTGQFIIDPYLVGAVATTAHASAMLAAIEEVLLRRAQNDAPESYSIAAKSFTLMSITELMRLRAMYRAELYTLTHRGRSRPGVKIRFTPTAL